MSRWHLLLALGGPWLALWVGCQGDPELALPSSSNATGVGGAIMGTGGNGDGGGGMGQGGDMPDGGVEPVRLGLVANTADADSGAGDRALAELTAFATGVRAVSVAVPWNALDDGAIAALATRVDGYVERELSVVLELMVVDGAADLRPEAVAMEAWDAPAVQVALTASIDALATAMADDLSAVVLARRADAYLADNPSAAAAFGATLGLASDRLTMLAIPHGVGLTYVAEETTTSAYRGLASLGDRLSVAYLPGLGATAIPVDISHAKALDQMIELADERPVHLYATGFPSATSIGGSGDTQAQQLDGFFDALDSRRASFPIVVVQQLADLDLASCDALLSAQGKAPGDPLGEHLCSTGLTDELGQDKPAWAEFLQASAHFAQP
jgi:hypothetical protein